MKDLEQARNLLRMAEKDCRALRGMEDAQVFSAEIFGFHVQQAVENLSPAMLSWRDLPKIHDLDELGTARRRKRIRSPLRAARLYRLP
jgi:hypothetical protein